MQVIEHGHFEVLYSESHVRLYSARIGIVSEENPNLRSKVCMKQGPYSILYNTCEARQDQSRVLIVRPYNTRSLFH